MTTMHNPPHPGETLREDVLPALGLTVTEAAAQLGVTRAALSRVLNGRAAISPEMALRLEGWLGVEKRRPGRWMARAASRVRPLESAHGRHACGEAGTGTARCLTDSGKA
jgi:addiction module HigA family antidote